MKRLFLTFICILAAGSFAFAQSASEIAAAKAMAMQYGYSETEINKFINHDVGQGAAAATVQTPVKGNVYGENIDASTPVTIVTPAKPASDSDIYGHSFFTSQGLGIIPSYNAPVPESFVLGPGDEIVVNIWGSTTTNFSGVIGKDGSVILAEAGPVAVGGLTLGAAEKLIKSRLSRIYGGLSGGSSHMQLTLGRIKGVSVNVIGEVATPGVYNLPSLSTVPSAIFMAGGLKSLGTVREIAVFRGGKKIGAFDLYDFMINGNPGSNFNLQENDIINVIPAASVVNAAGAVKRPLRYEIKEGETVADLIKFAGGFSSTADKSKAHVDRTVGFSTVSYDIPSSEFATFKIANRDNVTFYENRDPEIQNRVHVYGAVEHEGPYSLGDNLSTVSQLVKAAGGFKKGTYMDQAILHRVDDEGHTSMIQFNVADILQGKNDIKLQQQDRVNFYLVKDMVEKFNVRISGEVQKPGEFEYSEGMTLGSLIIMGGGFATGASLSNIEIASRGDQSVGKVVVVNLETNPEAMEIPLKAFDRVSVRKNTYYRPLNAVTVSGEVMFPGSYVIESNSIRISDVVERAGRFTKDAYLKGARVVRTMTAEERERLELAFDIAKARTGETNLTLEEIGLGGNTFVVGINLEAALAHKGSEEDLALRDGDEVIIPQMNNTVKITGAVLYPNVVGFTAKSKLKDYISQAGGYAKKARKSKVYAVYVNGTAASKGSRQFHMEPGMQIVVPLKEERQGLSAGEIASLASTSTSLAALVVTLIRTFAK